MYRNVYFQGIQRRPVNQQQNNGYAETPIAKPQYPQFKEISPAVNSALYAYASPIIRKPYDKMSLDEILLTLQKQGKIANKDYELEENGDRPWVNIFNERGQQIFRAEYDLQTQKMLDCEISSYKGNKQIRKISKNTDGNISQYEDFYYNQDIPQEIFTKEGFRYNSTPNEYIDYLKQNNINYKINYDGDEENNRSIHITEYNQNGKKNQSTWWYYGERQFNQPADIVSRSLYNDNEQEEKRITFDKDRTEVCTYVEKCKRNSYKNENLDFSKLTDAGITFNTKPEEYLQYLKNQQNINNKINIKKDGNKHNGSITIEEINLNNDIENSTAWIWENGKLERICRWENQYQSNRRRLDFGKDETDEMIISYG